jgi:adenosylcobinamide-GDP ribazoletransferase
VKSLLAAFAFLTRLPVGRMLSINADDVAHAGGWFPVVGAALGAFGVLTAAAAKDYLPASVVAVVLVLLDALATGALHFDGLADTADGLGGGTNREDILRIMRDHNIGTYGGLALAVCVALKVTAYAALLKQNNWTPALVLTPCLGRWSILILTAWLPYARPSESPASRMGKRTLAWGTATIGLALVWARSGRAVAAACMVAVVSACFGLYCRRRIAGITGDTLGANVQFCESAALVAFLWAGSAR